MDKLHTESKVPKEAKRVFKGVLFDIYQWEQKLFDGTVSTFEMAKMKDAVQIIPVTKDNKIIVSIEEQPQKGQFLSLIGGGFETDEDFEQCAKRELLEETGMKAKKFIYLTKRNLTRKLEHFTHYLIAKDCKIIQKSHLDSGEKITLLELDFEEFLDFTQKENFRNKFFKEYIFRIMHTPKEVEKLKKLLLS